MDDKQNKQLINLLELIDKKLGIIVKILDTPKVKIGTNVMASAPRTRPRPIARSGK
jgi:hypothetical protein